MKFLTMYLVNCLRLLVYVMIVVFVSCAQREKPFSEEDLEAQQAFIDLIEVTLNRVDKTVLIDSIKTLKLPAKEVTIKSYEKGAYVEKPIKLSEEDRRIHMYHDIVEIIDVPTGQCFLPSSDHKFSVEDFIYNVKPCLDELFPKIEDKLWAKFSKSSTINYPLFQEINRLLETYETEMGIVHLYSDSYYFIFFEKRNKTKVYAIFDRLGIQIGDHTTIFRDYKGG